MKLHEFRECIDKLDDYYQKEEFVEIQGKKFPIAKGDPYICVPVVTEETYIGPRPSTSVCLVEEGFDWEQGCIYLVTEKDVCLKKSTNEIGTETFKEDRCNKCVYTNQCLMNGTLHPYHPCEKYKRDPPDGGYYG